MNYNQRGVYSDHRIDNQMTINSKGEHLTKCWDSKGVYFVKTDPKSIRKPMVCGLWKVGDEPGYLTTAGWSQGIKR